MALNNTTADALANSICSSLSITDPTAVGQWKTICRSFFSSITTNGVVTIPAVAIATTGSATNQAGPPAPVSLAIS